MTWLQFISIYLGLGAIISVLFLREITGMIRDGQCPEFGVARVEGKFRIINWPRFAISLFLLSIVIIPLLTFTVLTVV